MDETTAPHEIGQIIDRACDAFEAGWRAECPPQIEQALATVGGPTRPRLLFELLRVEIELRHHRGDSPTQEEYLSRFPHDALVIARVFDEASARPALQQPGRTCHRSSAANLLYGLLALQNNLIRRDDLLSVAEAWVRDRRRSLAEIFRERKLLADDEIDLLDALYGKYLQRNAFEFERSLANLSSIGSVREELSAMGDRDLQCTLPLVGIGQRGETTDEHAHRRRSSDGETVNARMRLRILRKHAKGGLGQVAVALDEELGREIAFKEIQPEFADIADARDRFIREAEITGGLEHPGIVPVYGVGQYLNGRPFYAMRFIQGDSLHAAVRAFHAADKAGHDPGERRLALLKLLGRFLDVCHAVGYAHSRGVLHRDLKPGNIMLGEYGETLVVDWGLAKSIERGDGPTAEGETTLCPKSGSTVEETRHGSTIGTPGFMSPEQAAGKTAELGPATDIYALGATLYAVLTGQPPIGGANYEQIIAAAIAGNFAAPRDIKGWIPKPLEAICLKAMAKLPTDRYASTAALANDIERFMADERVAAHREGWFERVARWGRRYRAISRAAVFSLLAIAIVATAAAVLIQRQKQQAVEARQSENEAHQTTATVLDDVVAIAQGEALQRAGLEQIQERFLESAEEYYRRIPLNAETSLGRPKAIGAMAELATGLERHEDARAYHADAVKMLHELTRNDPADSETIDAYAAALNNRGIYYLQRGNTSAALSDFQASVKARRQLDKVGALPAIRRLKIVETLTNIATIYSDLGRLDDAEKTYRECESSLRKLISSSQTEEAAQHLFVTFVVNYGSFLNQFGFPERSRQLFEEALALAGEMSTSPAADPRLAFGKAACRMNLANSLNSADRLQELNTARAILDDLIEIFPRNRLFLATHAACYTSIGEALAESKDPHPDDIISVFKQAVLDREKLVRNYPAVLSYQVDFLKDRLAYAESLARVGLREDAEALFLKAMSKSAALHRQYPQNTAVNVVCGRIHHNSANFLVDQGRLEAATSGYAIARKRFEWLVEKHPTTAIYRTYLANAYSAQGKLPGLLPTDEAKLLFEKALEIRSALRDKKPSSANLVRDVASSYTDLAGFHEARKEFNSAIEYRDSAIRLREEALDLEPESAARRAEVGVAHFNKGATLFHAGQRDQLEPPMRKAIEHWTAVHEQGKLDPKYLFTAAQACFQVANLRHFAGDPVGAEEGWSKALSLWKDLPDFAMTTHLAAEATQNLGLLFRSLGRTEDTIKFLSSAAEEWMSVNQRNPTLKTAVYEGRAHANLAQIHGEQEDFVRARDRFTQAIAVLERARVDFDGGSNTEVKDMLLLSRVEHAKSLSRAWEQKFAKFSAGRASLADQAEEGMRAALELSTTDAEKRFVLSARAKIRSDAGRHTEAMEDASEIRRHSDDDLDGLMVVAEVCANAAAALEPEEQPTRKDYLEKAIEAILHGSKLDGFAKSPLFRAMRYSAKFAALRGDPRIRELLGTE